MNRIEAATSNSKRRVIDVQQLLGLPDSTPNPHLWYSRTDDARGRRGDRPRSVRARPCSRRLLQGPRQGLQRLPDPVAARAEVVRQALSVIADRDHRAGRRLHVAGRRRPDHDPLEPAGGHHERRRSGPAGRQHPEPASVGSQGQGAALQPAGDRHPDRRRSCRRPSTRASRSSASTRRCRSVTATSRGCSRSCGL